MKKEMRSNIRGEKKGGREGKRGEWRKKEKKEE